MTTQLLIDGDQFLFKACAAVEKEVRWDDQNHVLYSNAEEAYTNFKGMLGRIYERFDTEESILCWSSSPTFRHKLADDYKAGRSRKPLCYAELRSRAEASLVCKTWPGLEADDVMGLLATMPKRWPRTIIVSQDKDMKGVPGWLWDGENLVHISESEADHWHLMQTLTGDPTDGYKGCPGVGEVKAAKLLSLPAPRPWDRVVEAYQKAGLTVDDALLQARLARILRWSDWDNKRKQPILWSP